LFCSPQIDLGWTMATFSQWPCSTDPARILSPNRRPISCLLWICRHSPRPINYNHAGQIPAVVRPLFRIWIRWPFSAPHRLPLAVWPECIRKAVSHRNSEPNMIIQFKGEEFPISWNRFHCHSRKAQGLPTNLNKIVIKSDVSRDSVMQFLNACQEKSFYIGR
jgi:hypothetical protein